ncbi:hypothetical protein ACE10Z_25445 [Bradyrhizobium sp. Pha-3]
MRFTIGNASLPLGETLPYHFDILIATLFDRSLRGLVQFPQSVVRQG